MFTTAQDAVQLNKRWFPVRWRTWWVISGFYLPGPSYDLAGDTCEAHALTWLCKAHPMTRRAIPARPIL